MKVLLDENLSPRHVETVRALGHDAESVVGLGLSGADDTVVGRAAVEGGRILVPLDGDFANVLRYPPADTLRVLRLRLHPPTEEGIATALQFAIPRISGLDLNGKLVVVDARKTRIRG